MTPNGEDRVDKFFDFAMWLFIASHLIGWLALVALVIITYQGGYC